MMKNNIINILKRCVNLIYHYSVFLNVNFVYIISYFICFCFVVFILYDFYGINNVGTKIFYLILSFVFSYFVFSKIKFSKNLFIRLIQQFIIFTIGYAGFFYLFSFLNLFDIIHCDTTDDENDNNDNNNNNNENNNNNNNNNENNDNKDSNYNFSFSAPRKVVDDALKIGENIAKNSLDDLGAYAAGGTVGAAMAKATIGMAPPQRLAVVGAGAVVGSAGAKLGVKAAESISENLDLMDMVKTSEHANPDVNRIPSPGLGNNISSILESGDQSIPLVDLLEVIFSYNILELILILLIILVLSNNNINNLFVKFISNIIKKYIPSKYENWNKKIEKSKNYNNKFMKSTSILLIVLLLLIKLCNLFVSGILYSDINEYVTVYNYLKNINNKSMLLLILFNRLNINKKYTINNSKSIFNTPATYRYLCSASVVPNSVNNQIKSLDYINLDLETKINKFGSYENYLNQLIKDNAVTEEFLNENYPNLKNDDLFKLYLNELKPVIRTEVKYVLDLYEYIIKFNSFKDKIVIFNEYLNKDLLINLFKEYKDCRKEIISILRDLGYNDNYLDKLLFNLNKNIKNRILLEKSVLISSGTDEVDKLDYLKYEDDYINMWYFIKNLIEKDLNNSEILTSYSEKIKELENLFTNIYVLIKFIQENNISLPSSKELFLEKYRSEFILFSKHEKTETYKTNKGQIRTKKMRGGLIINGYKDILNDMKYNLESIILNKINESYNNKEIKQNLLENKEIVTNKINKIESIIQKDFNVIYDKVYKAFDINQFVIDISINISDKNLNLQYNKLKIYFEDIFKNSNTTHDDLINTYNLISKYKFKYIRINELNLSRESSLSSNSYLYLKCRDIINEPKISQDKKQLMLENFILNFEKEFTFNIIKNMDNNVNDYKLLTRIYKHSTSLFNDRIRIFIDNNKKRNYESYLKNKDNLNKLSDHIALALFITIDTDQLINIIFSKVVRFIGLSGGITQNELLVKLSDEMLVTFKYNLKNNKILEKLTSEEINIINDIKNKLDNLPFEVKYKFGDLLLELILDEFNYIFMKNNIYENNEHYIYISIKPEYLAILTGSIFNPIKLPMISKPKEWKYENLVRKITQIGGYYLDEFNELSKDNSIIRQNTINKFDSLISIDQINTINYLNSIPFEINKNMLEFIIKEWNNKNDNCLFKGLNKLHPLTNDFDKYNNSVKKDILSHNSKHWTYSNIINIALLMKDQTIYFPTFLDFRGRIYPTPNYLSYQSSDLARSFLLFKNTSSDINSVENVYYETIDKIMKDDLYANKNIKNKEKKFKEIDYFKLYLANTYGKNKLSRNGRIKWVDNNIDDIFNAFESNLEVFKNKYLLESKEPFQFLACIITYYDYIKNNNEIKIPILFDASCSGIQHLSALTTDIKISKLVNLLDNDEPSDFYQYCIDQIIEIIKNLDPGMTSSSAVAAPAIEQDKNPATNLKNKLLQLNIHRKWLKHSIMTIPYNVTNIGISDKLIKYFDIIFIDKDKFNKLESGEIQLHRIIEENLNKNILTEANKTKAKTIGQYIYVPKIEITSKNTNNLYFTQSELISFSKIIKSTVLNIIPPFNQLKFYFDKIIDILKKLDLPILWETPSGMTVSMSNRIMKSKQIKTSLIKKAKPISILIPTEQIDYKNIKTGLMPNFIHSLDASNIHILIKNILLLNKPDINIYTIHDCFASDYKNIALIELLVKHSFVELYFRKNYLETVHNSFILQINNQKEIFEENIVIDGKPEKNKYILISKTNKFKKNQLEKIYIPKLPDYKWNINKEIIYNELLFNSYFIS